MQRQKFSREFTLKAVVRERGVSVSQAARDLELHENVARAGGCASSRLNRTVGAEREPTR